MKSIDNGPIKDFKGENVVMGNEALTPSAVFLNTISLYRAPYATAGAAFKLGVKLSSVDASTQFIDLEDAEVQIVKDALKENPTGYVALILGQIFERLEN